LHKTLVFLQNNEEKQGLVVNFAGLKKLVGKNVFYFGFHLLSGWILDEKRHFKRFNCFLISG